MYCSSPDPFAGRTQIGSRMGGATQSKQIAQRKQSRPPKYMLFFLEAKQCCGITLFARTTSQRNIPLLFKPVIKDC
jgi:hypothetical protein